MVREVSGVFASPSRASAAVNDLVAAGVSRTDVAISREPGDTTVTPAHVVVERTGDNLSIEGMATGATVGSVIGAVAAGLSATGAVIGSGGVVLAAGPAVAALAGAGAGGATGGILGALIGLGLPERRSRMAPEVAMEEMSVLVSVPVAEDQDVARLQAVMRSAGASELVVR